MTWLKLGEEFTRETRTLSDAAFRTHVEGLAWVLDRETGGELDERDVRRFAETPDFAAAVDELVEVGYWRRTRTGYVIAHHMDEQPSPQYLRDKRRNNATRQARYREREALKARGFDPGQIEQELTNRGYPPTGRGSNGRLAAAAVTSDVTRYGTRDPERSRADRCGADRCGADQNGSSFEEGNSYPSEPFESWPTVQPGHGKDPTWSD